jgi:hypothetical protein
MKVNHNFDERTISLYAWYGGLLAFIEYDENRVIIKQVEFKSGALATLKDKFFYLNLTVNLSNTNHLIEIAGIDIIGVLCINDELQGFLSYVQKFSNKDVDYGDDKFYIDQLHSQAEVFCALNNVKLIMY